MILSSNTGGTKQRMLCQVTSIVSKHTLCMDGMSRHVRVVRRFGNNINTGHVSHGLVCDILPRPLGLDGSHILEADAVNMPPVKMATDCELPVGPLGEAKGDAAENQGGDGAQLPAEEVEPEADADRLPE